MKWYRISKYNPKLRNSEGKYLDNDWTSFSDIGKKFNENILTLKKFIVVEDQYISTILCFLDALNITELDFIDQEIYNSRIEYPNKINNRDIIVDLIRNILRENVWGKLIFRSEIEIHFGYDLYVYIGISNDSNNLITSCVAPQDNIFIENIIVSPYYEE